MSNSHKLKSKSQGPYPVVATQVNGNNAVYILKDPSTNREWTVNAELLREFHPTTFLNQTKHTKSGLAHDTTAVDAPVPGPHAPLESGSLNFRDTDLELATPSTSGSVNRNDTRSRPVELARKRSDVGSVQSSSSAVPEKMVKRHKSHMRHTTGSTKQSLSNIAKRDKDNSLYTRDANSMKEYVLDKILSHRKVKNQYRYMISWEDPTIPHQEILTQDFVTTDILKEYWDALAVPTKQKPARFRPKLQ